LRRIRTDGSKKNDEGAKKPHKKAERLIPNSLLMSEFLWECWNIEVLE